MHQYLYLSIYNNAFLLTTSQVSLPARKKALSLGGWFYRTLARLQSLGYPAWTRAGAFTQKRDDLTLLL